MALYRVLQETALHIKNQPDQVKEYLAQGIKALQQNGFNSVDYRELCDAQTLHTLPILDRPARLLAAAYLGKTRLIDNIAVEK